MAEDVWYELWRVSTVLVTRGGAVLRFLAEWFERPPRWEWIDRDAGTFALVGTRTIYRVRVVGRDWLFEWQGGS